MNITTTIVGSYPVISHEPNSFKDKFRDHLGIYDKYHDSIVHTTSVFAKNGIDVICDGQPRDDMVKIFASKINGFDIIDNSVHVIGKITPSAHPIGVNDLKLAYNVAHKINNKYQLNASFDDIFKGKAKGIKGMLTGPTSIIHSCAIDNFYANKQEAIFDLAKALCYEAKELQKAGACAIQIDEPFISTGVEDVEVSKEAVEIIAQSVDIPVVMHVCGDLKDVLKDLLKFDVEVLDFEFQGQKDNINTLKKAWSKNTDKKIAIGCIDTKLHEVDNEEDVKNTISKVVDIMQNEDVIIDPDCGMRMLDEQVAIGKLEILNNIKNGGI